MAAGVHNPWFQLGSSQLFSNTSVFPKHRGIKTSDSITPYINDTLLIYFHSLNCSQEFIEIYDGALYTSPLLGKICNGSNLNYESSSNAMTVLLYRNSPKSGYGFLAYYYSTSREA
uniref:CUB domain-containing protein n=1 Tax=Pelusios castaneus TaxID=367368 RepID=A0A8C8VK44_9SAUR